MPSRRCGVSYKMFCSRFFFGVNIQAGRVRRRLPIQNYDDYDFMMMYRIGGFWLCTVVNQLCCEFHYLLNNPYRHNYIIGVWSMMRCMH